MANTNVAQWMRARGGDSPENRKQAQAQFGWQAVDDYSKSRQQLQNVKMPDGFFANNWMLKNQPIEVQRRFFEDQFASDPELQKRLAPAQGQGSASAGSAAPAGSTVSTGAAAAAANASTPGSIGGTTAVKADIKYDEYGRPIRNDYMSILDGKGNLNKQYSLADKIGPDINLNTQAQDEIRNRAMSTGPSAWANLALQKQGIEQSGMMDQNARSMAQSRNQAFNDMRSRGGLSGGQRERLAMQGQRNQLLGSQGVRRQGLLDRANILTQDQQSKDQMLMQVPGMDMNAANFAQGQRAFNTNAQQFDIGNKLRDVGGLNAYNSDAYGKAMQEWGAEKTANAQANASSGGGGGCCFIFLEARYGDGTMDSVVRRFRDENMTDTNKRGYYKLSEVLVPVMRKSKLAKFAVRALMTDPMVAYGKAHYGEGSKLGFIFKPVVKFWLKAFEYLGGEHPFIRENGQTV